MKTNKKKEADKKSLLNQRLKGFTKIKKKKKKKQPEEEKILNTFGMLPVETSIPPHWSTKADNIEDRMEA